MNDEDLTWRQISSRRVQVMESFAGDPLGLCKGTCPAALLKAKVTQAAQPVTRGTSTFSCFTFKVLVTAPAPSFLLFKQGRIPFLQTGKLRHGEGWFPWNLMRWEALQLPKHRTGRNNTLLSCLDCPAWYQVRTEDSNYLDMGNDLGSWSQRKALKKSDMFFRWNIGCDDSQFPHGNRDRPVWLWVCLLSSGIGGSSVMSLRLKGYYQNTWSQEKTFLPSYPLTHLEILLQRV